MKYILLLILALVAGCAEGYPIRDYALRLETDRSVCGATKVGPDMIETAAHCVTFRLQSLNGIPVRIVSSQMIAPDRIRIVVSGIRFKTWAPLGSPVVTERVRWWGQPMGIPFVYREGRIGWVSHDRKVIAVDGTICHGDSGSGLFNDAGELVGVVSAMTNENGCTFLVGAGK